MRKKSTRVTALVLAVLLTLGPTASASQALGTEIHLGKTHLAEGVDYTRQYLWSATYSDLRTERYLEYTPNELVQPAVAYGDTILSKSTLSDLALSLEEDGMRVLGGINGDYFVVATGAPLGMVVTDGILRSSSSYHYALGFDADGNAFIGKPELSITATFGGNTFDIAGGLNKVRTNTGGFVLYTEDYGPTTNHALPGIDVILTPNTDKLGKTVDVVLDVEEVDEPEPSPAPAEEEEPITGSEDLNPEDLPEGNADSDAPEVDEPDTAEPEDEEIEEVIKDTLVYTDVPVIGGRISCTVEQVLHSDASIEIPEGSLILSINNSSHAWLVQMLSSLQQGDIVEIDIASEDKRWENVVTAVGGLYKMVTDGAVESGLETSQAPRTAVGIRPDGSTIFYTVDGRQSGYSVGASMEQVAKRLVELGCVEAVCMDGGGSTTLGASLPGEEYFDVLNSPSDGSQRAVSNALFLVAEQDDPGRARQLVLSPSDAMLLSGAQLEFSAFSVDDLGQTVGSYEADELDFAFSENAGTVEDGILTAGRQTGTYTLEALADRLSGEAIFTVVSTPDRIMVTDEETGVVLSSIHVEPGDSLSLSASAVYRNLPLISQDENFTWDISEGMGTIDQQGNLIASPISGAGSVTVSAGEFSVTIPLTVSGHIHTVDNFEGDFGNMTSTNTALIEPEESSSYVRYGTRSARITYNMGESEFARVGTELDLQEGEKYLNLWVYGDGSGNTLTASVQLADGSIVDQIFAVLNFKGWQQITTTLPAGSTQIQALNITPTGTLRQGLIWLDQITSSNQYVPDNTAPVISVELADAALGVTIHDNIDEQFSASQISVTYDGQALPFTGNESGTVLLASLPAQDGLSHRVTVTVTDASGNIGRASADITATLEREAPFADMSGHWAENYVNYLYDQGISTGLAVGDVYYYNPDKYITRGEFALMTIRWLGLDPASFRDVELPFTDVADIPAWCLDGIKAMYALGIMQGSAEAGGTYAFAQNSISRAEAMTMLGRIQQKGYPSAELTFADTDSIPSWATDYMATMTAQGVINGYNNMVSPNASLKRGEMAKILYTMR